MKRQVLVSLCLLASISLGACATAQTKISTVSKDINAITCGTAGAPPAPACLQPAQSATLLGDSSNLSTAVTAEQANKSVGTIAAVAAALVTFFADAATYVQVDLTTIVKDVKAVLAGL